MTVREVVVSRDIRAPAVFSAGFLLRRHAFRRSASMAFLATIDVLGVLCAVAVVPALLASAGATGLNRPSPRLLVAAVAFTVAAFAFEHLYGLRGERHRVVRVVRALLWALVAVVLFAVVFDEHLDGVSLAAIWLGAMAIILGARWVYDRVLTYAFGDDLATRPVLFLGSPSLCHDVAGTLRGHGQLTDCRLIGVVDAETAMPAADADFRVLGRIEDLDQVLALVKPDELIVADRGAARDFMPAIIDACRRRRIVLRLVTLDLEGDPGPVTYVPGLGAPVFVVRATTASGIAFVAKRVFDLALACTLIVLAAPFIALVALAIKLDSRGPAFFVNTRIGLGQQPFRCFKFRTMRADAPLLQVELEPLNECGGAIFKIRDDPRITRMGRLLRRTSLDELPQLLNVVKGEMSLVGPRPLPLRDFGLLDDVYKQRHVVLPGMTGLWQVSGRSQLSFDDMIDLDLRYIETWSLGSDAAILARTVGAVFGLTGAY